MRKDRVMRNRAEVVVLTSRESMLVNKVLTLVENNKTIDDMAYAGRISPEYRQEIALAFSKHQYNQGIISKDEILKPHKETLTASEVWNDRFCDTCRLRLTSQDLIKHAQDGKSLCIKHRNEINYRRNGNVIYGSSIR